MKALELWSAASLALWVAFAADANAQATQRPSPHRVELTPVKPRAPSASRRRGTEIVAGCHARRTATWSGRAALGFACKAAKESRAGSGMPFAQYWHQGEMEDAMDPQPEDEAMMGIRGSSQCCWPPLEARTREGRPLPELLAVSRTFKRPQPPKFRE
jgi:hypothetical protein